MKILFRRLSKSKSLRIVNLLGLSVVFACLLLSYCYVKKEYSYDRFHHNAERILRLSTHWGDGPVDGRVPDYATLKPGLEQLAGIKDFTAFEKVETMVLTYQNESYIVNNLFLTEPNFFNFFTFGLTEGDKNSLLQSGSNAVISENLARRLFRTEQAVGKTIRVSSRKFEEKDMVISGVFKNLPENSHFFTDIVVCQPYEKYMWPYVYLLRGENVTADELEKELTQLTQQLEKEQEVTAALMPLTDIHLHSRVQRELSENSNIYYIYLIVGANALLLLIVLFNLWLNSGLLFSYNRRYYQLLRLNGASSFIVIRDEVLLNLVQAAVAMLAGGFIAFGAASGLGFDLHAGSIMEWVIICMLFLFIALFTALIPVLRKMSATLFFNTETDLDTSSVSFSGIKYALILQYCIVMFVVIIAFGISKQVALIHDSQMGKKEKSILVTKEQPDAVKDRYDVLKTELLKHPEILSVTASMQLPGEAIRDGVRVKKEGEKEYNMIRPLVVGEDFFPFFHIQPLAGSNFKANNLTYKEEFDILIQAFEQNSGTPFSSGLTEQYIINKEALPFLGFSTPEEAIGQKLVLQQSGGLDYINQGEICGVVDNFTYTSIHEKSFPMLIFQRNMFLHCIMVRLDPDNTEQALAVFNKVWDEVNPDFPSHYTFMQHVYGNVYKSELNAERLIGMFSLLCFLIADLGLIVFMAFIIKRRTREIGIRKVNGASVREIVWMLNVGFIKWLLVAFVAAVPLSYFVLQRWLENFAYKATLSWWIFVFAGLLVFILSAISLSWQSWRAATANPVDAIKVNE